MICALAQAELRGGPVRRALPVLVERLPPHATSVPPTRNSGAAYSAVTASAATPGPSQDRAAPSPPGIPRRARGRPGRSRARSAYAVRSRKAHLRPGSPAARTSYPEARRPEAGRESLRRTRDRATACAVRTDSSSSATRESARWSSTMADGSRMEVGAWGRGESLDQPVQLRDGLRPAARYRSAKLPSSLIGLRRNHVSFCEERALPLDETRVSLQHLPKARCGVAVDAVIQVPLEHRKDIPDERPATRHPLVVRPPAVVIRAVQPAVRKALDEPAEDGLMPDVHPERHLRLLPVPAERSLADQQAHDDPAIKVRKF